MPSDCLRIDKPFWMLKVEEGRSKKPPPNMGKVENEMLLAAFLFLKEED